MGWGIDDESDPAANARALREAENGLRQARRVAELIRSGVMATAVSPLSPTVIAKLNGLAVDGVVSTAGRLRVPSDLEILGSRHQVPPHGDVPELVEAACAFVREHWAEGRQLGLHLALSVRDAFEVNADNLEGPPGLDEVSGVRMNVTRLASSMTYRPDAVRGGVEWRNVRSWWTPSSLGHRRPSLATRGRSLLDEFLEDAPRVGPPRPPRTRAA